MQLKLSILIIVFILIGCGGAKSGSDSKPISGNPDDKQSQQTPPQSTTEGRDIPTAWKLGDAAPNEKVTIVTSDQIEISANYRPPAGSPSGKVPALICIPMLGKTKDTYDEFTSHLSEIGIASLAIDVRGHGESTMKGSLRYGSFKEQQWQDCLKDLNAAFGWLLNRNDIDDRHIGFIGASIGANFALMGGTRNEVGMVVALSPGLDFHGVTPKDYAAKIKGKPVYLIATDGDKYSADSVSTIAQAMEPSVKVNIIENRREHGTDIFKIPAFQEELIRWIKDQFDAMIRVELNTDNPQKKGKPGAITVPR